MPGEGKRNRQKGDRRELELARGLRLTGWYVERSSASGGPFDIIAERRDLLLHIQLKSNCWPSPEEREEMIAEPTFHAGRAYLVCARIDDGASAVRVLVTQHAACWTPNIEIEEILTKALVAERLRRRQ
jgi:hypothetical protein